MNITTQTSPAPSAASAVTRRSLIAGAVSAAALLTLAACSPRSGSGAGDASGATRTVTIAGRKVSVPADPQRIVSIDYFTGVFLTELGLTPVGGIDYSWVDAASMFADYVAPLKKIHDIGEITATDIEKVAALKPDLVLGPTPGSQYDNSPGALKKLGAVAPAVGVDFGATGDWRDPFAQTAAAVNRSSEHARLEKHYAAAIADARAVHADAIAGTTIASLNYADNGQFSLDLAPSSAGVVYRDLGLTFTESARGTDSNGVVLSFEQLDRLADADLIVYRADAAGNPASGLDALVALDAWKQLPAVAAGNVHPITWIDLCTYRWAEAALAELVTLLPH